MGYIVSRYKNLFSQGTFDAPKILKTWNESHRLFAQNQVREEKKRETLALGLVLEKGHLNFPQGGFCNYRLFEIDPQKRSCAVIFHNEGEYPVKAFKEAKNLELLTTLGYFYFTTNPKMDEVSPPQIKVNNLFVYRGQTLQLPVVDRSALVVFKNGRVEIPFVKARGTLKIGENLFKWQGAKTLAREKYLDDGVVVYNGSAGTIEPYDDPVIGPGRLAKRVLTPKDTLLDLVVHLKNGQIEVGEIRSGGTEATRGLGVLSGPKTLLKDVKKGERISEVVIDDLKEEEIADAVSVGPRIFQDKEKRRKQLLAEGLEDDKALCNRPHRDGLKLARSFLVKLKNNDLVSVLIDGIPQAGNIYPGITPQEAADFIFIKYPQAQVVVATDPGGTMKGIYKDKEGKIEVFGNLHYLDYRYNKDGAIAFWPNGYLGRGAVTFLGVA